MKASDKKPIFTNPSVHSIESMALHLLSCYYNSDLLLFIFLMDSLQAKASNIETILMEVEKGREDTMGLFCIS